MAGRSPKPWFWQAKQAWYVILHGKRVRLGTDKEKALRRFHRLMAEQGGAAIPDSPLTVGELTEQYLTDLTQRAGERTVYVARCYLKPFVADCQKLLVRHVRPHHVQAVVRKHGRWNATTENHVLSRILAVYNWAVKRELMAINPLRGLRKPKARCRGTQTLIAPENHVLLMEGAPPYLRNVLFALQQTGARPCEVLRVTKADLLADQGIWVLDRHKTAHETGKPRIIFLTPQVATLCKELAERNPTGPLFRRASGKAFPEAYYLARLVRRLCRRLGIQGIIPYGYRHTFATDALASGVPDAQVAELLGHQSTAMLHKHYAHLIARARVMKDALAASDRLYLPQPRNSTEAFRWTGRVLSLARRGEGAGAHAGQPGPSGDHGGRGRNLRDDGGSVRRQEHAELRRVPQGPQRRRHPRGPGQPALRVHRPAA